MLPSQMPTPDYAFCPEDCAQRAELSEADLENCAFLPPVIPCLFDAAPKRGRFCWVNISSLANHSREIDQSHRTFCWFASLGFQMHSRAAELSPCFCIVALEPTPPLLALSKPNPYAQPHEPRSPSPVTRINARSFERIFKCANAE